jgi:hypothetical protein
VIERQQFGRKNRKVEVLANLRAEVAVFSIRSSQGS